MTIIEIPYSPVNLMIFTGDQERNVFDLKVKHQYPEWESQEDSDGMHFQNHIYIYDYGEKEVLIHETIHFLEWLFEYMEIEKESEFKSCISTLVLIEILKEVVS